MIEYGIDIGSVSLKLAEFFDTKLTRTAYHKHKGSPYNLLLKILQDIKKIDRLVLTGGLVKPLISILGAVEVNEVEATTRGVLHFHPEVKSIIEIGGEDSRLITVHNSSIRDFASNTICAAGTGIFLDQQAKRLCFDIEEFGQVGLKSNNPARIAGRCSVFAKSDMIHLQQIGTPVEDLIAGLCLALARNFKSVIAKGKEINRPVVFVGGVAGNKGIVKAFQNSLNIGTDELIIPEYYNCIGAIGAVLAAREKEKNPQYRGIEEFKKWLNRPRVIKRLPPLNGRKKWHPIRDKSIITVKKEAYLGIDIGSISTNLVLIDEKGNVLARKYLWTKGRPIEVVLEGLKTLKQEVGDRVDIKGVGTTGSGRYLIGQFIGADLIKNEISAQARAGIEAAPDVDTIFEIGGQDSKYISIENGTIVDFEMNKVCAAGTGSFLEEQAEILGVDLEEFGDQALKAKAPINLGERCTVFINSEVIHHQRDKDECENLLAGLGYSIVFNYLNRVVAGKKIGKKILFQGGVAANKAVVSAFEEVLKKEIKVPANWDVTGAIGIALMVRDLGIKKTKFKGLNLVSKSYSSHSFICNKCSNECEINEITITGEKPIFYGGRCGRYEEKEKSEKTEFPDLFALRNRIFFKTEETTGMEIGIPKALIFYELFPFFYRFLKELGFKPILSGPTTRKVIEMGAEASGADTCLPVKVAMGHIKSLLNKNINIIFIPSVITVTPNEKIFSRAFVCPYVQALPYMVRSVYGEKVKVYSPYLYFDRGRKGIEESLYQFGARFGKNRSEVRSAIDQAIEYQKEVKNEISRRAREFLKELNGPAFVICSRPYNGYDLGMNLDLPKKIRAMDIPAIPLDFLPLDYTTLKDDFYNMYWHYGQRLLAGAEYIARHQNLFPVYISNFSCGPDSFLTRFFKEKLGKKPSLFIELDEHTGDAGFITRCEAFYDSIKGTRFKGTTKKINPRSDVQRERKIYIPYMCDAARVLASAMRYAGINAEVMPFPDQESIDIGRKYTTGRECLPAIITAGDMIKKLRSPDFIPEKSGFFMAQGSGPCRFGQYYKLHRIILDELGYKDIPIYAPNQGPSLFDDLGKMGLKFLRKSWDGICAVDGLEALKRKCRPYELNKGQTDKIYNKALNRICALLENGEDILSYLKEVKNQFNSIEKSSNSIPRIGVVGEIYVRTQAFSNNFLINKLESLGCEVELPSIAEWFFYTNFTRIRNCRWFAQYRRAAFTRIFDQFMKWRQKKIYKLLGLEREATIKELFNYAAPYLHPSFEGEAILSVAKTIEFINNKFSGVINVMPFTCMPGNIVNVIYKKIKQNYPDFPLFMLALDGLDHAADNMRLETFVSQARAYMNRKG